MSPVGYYHGRTVMRLGYLLTGHLQNRAVGEVVTEVGFTLARDPDTVRAPDIAFLRRERIPPRDARGFFNGPPDLAIEVLSPDDRPGDMRDKVAEYLARGVRLVVVVDPDQRIVTTHRPATPPETLRDAADALDLDEVIAGFRCPLHEIFGVPTD
jgi:Uma2 family endonuclease